MTWNLQGKRMNKDGGNLLSHHVVPWGHVALAQSLTYCNLFYKVRSRKRHFLMGLPGTCPFHSEVFSLKNVTGASWAPLSSSPHLGAGQSGPTVFKNHLELWDEEPVFAVRLPSNLFLWCTSASHQDGTAHLCMAQLSQIAMNSHSNQKKPSLTLTSTFRSWFWMASFSYKHISWGTSA